MLDIAGLPPMKRCGKLRKKKKSSKMRTKAEMPNPEVAKADKVQLSREAPSAGMSSTWRQTMQENFREYVAERNPDATNNQAMGIMANLMVRLRKQS